MSQFQPDPTDEYTRSHRTVHPDDLSLTLYIYTLQDALRDMERTGAADAVEVLRIEEYVGQLDVRDRHRLAIAINEAATWYDLEVNSAGLAAAQRLFLKLLKIEQGNEELPKATAKTAEESNRLRYQTPLVHWNLLDALRETLEHEPPELSFEVKDWLDTIPPEQQGTIDEAIRASVTEHKHELQTVLRKISASVTDEIITRSAAAKPAHRPAQR